MASDRRDQRIRLVLHGGKVADEVSLREAIESLRARGFCIDVRATFETGDARAIACEAVQLGVGRVIACGGDGTLNEVLCGLLDAGESETSLGILPLGTANDFARAASIPLDDPNSALELAVTGRAHPIDVAYIDERPFLNVATAGFATDVTQETPEEMKNALGRAAYLVTGLRKFRSIGPTRARLVADGLDETLEFLVLAVGNARSAGGGHVLCPDASIDDGLLDVVVISEGEGGGPVATAAELITRGIEGSKARVTRRRVSALEVHAEEPLQVSVDGEPYGGRTVRFSVRAGALDAVIPADSPLRSP